MSSDRGSATVLAAVQCLALLFLFSAVVHIGAAVLARHRVEGAADLAALAAAAHIDQEPCEYARRVATSMGTGLDECWTGDLEARVWVSMPLSGPLGEWKKASARAHSGPVAGEWSEPR